MYVYKLAVNRKMKVSAPRMITRLPSSLKLGLNYPAFPKKMAHKPLLMDGELSDGSGRSKLPKGFLAVYVGPESRRFVIPVSFLDMPDFRDLMERVAEEFGCDHHGALQIPCDEEHFEHILTTCCARQRITSSKNHKKIKLGKMRRHLLI